MHKLHFINSINLIHTLLVVVNMDPTAITVGLKWSRTLPLSRYIEAIYSRTNWPLSVSARTQGHMGGQSADKVCGGCRGGGGEDVIKVYGKTIG